VVELPIVGAIEDVAHGYVEHTPVEMLPLHVLDERGAVIHDIRRGATPSLPQAPYFLCAPQRLGATIVGTRGRAVHRRNADRGNTQPWIDDAPYSFALDRGIEFPIAWVREAARGMRMLFTA